MKKYFISLTLMLLAFFSLQQTQAQPFSGGVLIGANSSQIAGDSYSGFDKAGLSGGVFVRMQLNAQSGLQMELFYTQKGSRSNSKAEESGSAPYLLRLNYVELPLIYQYDLGHLRLEAGLTAGFLTNSYEEVDYLENVQNVWRKISLNSLIGIRYIFTDEWSLGLRSINSINSIRTVQASGNVKRYGNKFGAFNDVLQLAVFYQF
ncbi:MAG: PorT family protein [Bacteroidetes bacterium]|nr:PorT family protein [Bacteroidota bacterium]MBU1577794.1 PorT family protein [Bacteroidota bacterium]MBU2465632.1 PorT family protein [Bacteroidota bacterium]MBU2558754.1 PorT family protein [Bacteroidota bacterium]